VTKEELRGLTKEEIGRRIREGVKAIIEQVLEEEMTEHLAAGYRERTPSRRGERNGHYTRGLITPVGRKGSLESASARTRFPGSPSDWKRSSRPGGNAPWSWLTPTSTWTRATSR